MFLKKEKLKAEHERNLTEIRAKQLEEQCRRLMQGNSPMRQSTPQHPKQRSSPVREPDSKYRAPQRDDNRKRDDDYRQEDSRDAYKELYLMFLL